MSRYYISTGALNKMYTLRHQFEELVSVVTEFGDHTFTIIRDYYICNLATDPTRAVENAKAQGYDVGEPQFTLEEIQRRMAMISEAERQRITEESERIAREEQTARNDKLIGAIQRGVYPFGMYRDKPLTSAPLSYVHYWLSNDNEVEDPVITTLQNALAAIYPDLVNLPKVGNGNYFGTVGVRCKDVKLRLIKEFCFNSFYGVMYVQRFLSETGELLLYKGSAPLNIKLGETGVAAFTVGAHSTYEGENQTVIKRPKVGA